LLVNGGLRHICKQAKGTVLFAWFSLLMAGHDIFGMNDTPNSKFEKYHDTRKNRFANSLSLTQCKPKRFFLL